MNKFIYIGVLWAPVFLFVVAAVYPWSLLLADGYHNHQRLVQIGLLSVVAALSSTQFATLRCFFRTANVTVKFLLLVLIGGLLSAYFSALRYHALLHYMHWLLLLILLIYTASLILNTNICQIFLGCFISVQALGAYIGIGYLIIAISLGHELNADVIYPGVENIRTYNQIQMFALPLLIFLLDNKKIKTLVIVILLMNFLLLFVGGSRGALLSLLLTLGFMSVFEWLRSKVFLAVALLVSSFIIYSLCLYLRPEGMQELYRVGTSGRVEMWLEIISSLRWENIILGVGPGCYVVFETFIFGHPHNSILQILIEWGGLAMLGVCVIFFNFSYVTYQYIKRNSEDYLTQSIAASLFAALLYSLVDGVFVMPVAQTLLIIFMGLLLGRIYREKLLTVGSESDLPYRQGRRIGVTGVIALLIVLVTVPYIFLTSVYYVQQLDSNAGIRGPNFWVNGSPLKSNAVTNLRLDSAWSTLQSK